MKSMDVMMVRIYLTEGSGELHDLVDYLHDESKVQGVTVFRGIEGFGKSGKIHSSSLLDFSLDLPVVIEFYDKPEKAEKIIEHLNETVKPGLIVQWRAKATAGTS